MIRKVYSDLILRKLRNEGPAWLIRRMRQYILIHISPRLRRPLCGPALGTLMVTYRCNLHCRMCDMPQKAACYRQEGREEFSTERFIGIIREFASLGIPGIGFTGGEPLLREDIFELMAETRRQGMIAHLNTNGWLLEETEAEKVIETGVDSVNISLDGATAATHDGIRKREGSFERATAAVRRLVRLKRERGSHVRIKTVAVLDEANIDEAPDMIALGKDMGTDCIEFIPRQPFTSPDGQSVPASPEVLDKVDRLVAKILAGGFSGVPLENSPHHLKLFHQSFAGKPSPLRCTAGYNSIGVDCYGDIFPCVPWINWGKSIGSLDNKTLAAFWKSPECQTEREKISKCRDCYLNCQAEMNLLFDLTARIRL